MLSLPPIGICEIRIALAAPRPGLPRRRFRRAHAARPGTPPQIPRLFPFWKPPGPSGPHPGSRQKYRRPRKTNSHHSQIRKTPRGASGARVRFQSLDRALGGASDRLGLCSRGIRPHPTFSPFCQSPLSPTISLPKLHLIPAKSPLPSHQRGLSGQANPGERPPGPTVARRKPGALPLPSISIAYLHIY